MRKNVFRGKLAAWNLEFCNSCVVLLRNVQVPRRNSDSHLVCCDPSHLRSEKTYLEEISGLEPRILYFLRRFTSKCTSSTTKFRFALSLLWSYTCVRKNVFRGKLAAWNLEFCNSCVVLLRNVQVPRRNSDSHLVSCDPHSCVRKNVFRGKLAAWNLEFCNSCVVLLRNVQVPRRNSDSHLVCCDPSHLRAKKRI
jgi:hypothetical protein